MKTKKIIIIVAAAVVLAAAGFTGYKILSNRQVYNDLNVTSFKCFMGKTLTDADLDEVEEVLNEAVKNKVLAISKGGVIPPQGYVYTNESGEETDMGDSITVIFSILDEDEKMSVFGALADKYGITPDYLPEGLGKDMYRADYGKPKK